MTVAPLYLPFIGDRRKAKIKQYVIKEKNSRWGFTIIKQVRDLAWQQIHLHSLCSHKLGYRALFQLTVCANSVGVCVHQMNKKALFYLFVFFTFSSQIYLWVKKQCNQRRSEKGPKKIKNTKRYIWELNVKNTKR